MSTTLELPDDVMREVEKQAARAGTRPGEFLAAFLRHRLVPLPDSAEGTIVPKTLPLIKGRQATPDKSFTTQQEWCDWLKEQEIRLDMESYEKAFGHQLVDRADG